MYSHCVFCSATLGDNDSVEHFPVGRRLAFDAAKGRLWVVCARCARWNLTPIEERWEAIEQCERLFRDTRLRMSTENVGLARLRDGTELVRIGAPERPEMAAWRYGRQLVRRLGGGVVASMGVVAAGAALSVAASGLTLSALVLPGMLALNVSSARRAIRARRTMATVPLADGRVVRVNGWYAASARLRRSSVTDEMQLRVLHADGDTSVTGPAIVPALARLAAAANLHGALSSHVASAVRLLDAAGGPEAFLESVSRRPYWSPPDAFYLWQMSMKPEHARRWVSNPPSLAMMPLVDRLALEMAANEEVERAALEGELYELERAWREADGIATIADELLLPADVEARLRRLRDRAASDG